MAFDKEKYWQTKADNVASKRKKPNINYGGDVEIGFDDNGMVVKNRLYRRKKIESNLFRKKGFIAHLNAVKITRKKNGKTKTKLFFID